MSIESVGEAKVNLLCMCSRYVLLLPRSQSIRRIGICWCLHCGCVRVCIFRRGVITSALGEHTVDFASLHHLADFTFLLAAAASCVVLFVVHRTPESTTAGKANSLPGGMALP